MTLYDEIVVLLLATTDEFRVCHERSLPLIDHATFFNRVKRTIVVLNHPASTCQSSPPPLIPSSARRTFFVHRIHTRAGPTFSSLSSRCATSVVLIKTRSKWREACATAFQRRRLSINSMSVSSADTPIRWRSAPTRFDVPWTLRKNSRGSLFASSESLASYYESRDEYSSRSVYFNQVKQSNNGLYKVK